MGSGNAIRVTEPETFTLIQLEEERQKLKKKELLKNMLTDSEFSIQGQCAINLMMTKIDIINTFLLMKTGRNYIQMKAGRLKSYDSVCKKMQKKGLDMNFAQAVEKINDLIGVRAVCAYVDDIYKVADLIQKQQDIRIIKIKDYIKQPKKSGYQSLQLILEIAKVIRLGFLQQNAFHKDDTCVSLEKQFKMMDVILYLYKTSRKLVAMGMPMSVLKAEGIFEKVIAIKYDVPNDNLQLLDLYKRDIDDFYNRVIEKNA